MFRLLAALVLVFPALVVCVPTDKKDDQIETAATWREVGQREVERAESRRIVQHRAHNVLFFLGDGMGPSTVTAARILKGGESSLLAFEHFPNTALSKTYCADHQVTDSAAAATAYLCGVKTNKGTLGLDPRVAKGDCPGSLRPDMQLTSILDWSLSEGKSVGLVTTTRITHATPGGAYANTAHRDWEGDSELPDSAKQAGCRDIARQLVEDYPNIQVLMGGGRDFFLPANVTDPQTHTSNAEKGRRDFRDLTKEWQQNKNGSAAYVWNLQQLRNLDLSKTDYLMGLFSRSHMSYEKERNDEEEPSLSDMTAAAIKILNKNPNGFFLLVEGGRIDHAHHENVAFHALHETVAFADAIETASTLTSEQETLTVATADHSHTMVIAGYQMRGNPILNTADDHLDQFGKTYTTLLYGTGPGYRVNQLTRVSITNEESNDPSFVQESAVPMISSAHGGEDVAIYGRGPMSHLLHGVHEQNYIAHLMAYASCVGPYRARNRCPPVKELQGQSKAPDNARATCGESVSSSSSSANHGGFDIAAVAVTTVLIGFTRCFQFNFNVRF